jgi:WD40 repeat protein
MTSADRFESTIAEWLDAESAFHLPDHLGEVVAQTAVTRQRRWWSSLERWLPMDIPTRAGTLASPRLGRALLVVLLVLAVVGIAIVAVGSRQQRVPPPFGPAVNGELLSSADGDIFRVDPTSGATTPLIAGPENDFGPLFSRDGTKFLFLRGGDNGLDIVVANADGTGAHVVRQVVNGPDWVDWSPDGSRIAFLSRTGDRGEINIVNVDGSGLRRLDVGQPANEFSWLPPDGNEIVFRGEHQVASDPPPAILAVRPDGSGLRAISTRAAVDENDFQDVAVSPDGTRVAYRYPGPDVFSVRVLDLQTGTERALPQPADTAQFGGPFSPDGRSLLLIRSYPDRTVQLVVVPADGSGTGVAIGPRAPFGPDGPTINNQVWSADGKAVMANYDTEKLNRLLPIDGSPPIVLARGELAFGAYQRLAP